MKYCEKQACYRIALLDPATTPTITQQTTYLPYSKCLPSDTAAQGGSRLHLKYRPGSTATCTARKCIHADIFATLPCTSSKVSEMKPYHLDFHRTILLSPVSPRRLRLLCTLSLYRSFAPKLPQHDAVRVEKFLDVTLHMRQPVSG